MKTNMDQVQTPKEEFTSKLFNQQLPQWKTTKSINDLTLGDKVIYDERISKVTFLCTDYAVITPTDMQYGICVFKEYIYNILHLQLPNEIKQTTESSN